MSAQEAMAAAVATIKAAKDEAAKHVKEAVKESVKAVFASDELVRAVRWRQYTPYFNDGDACVFSVHGVEAQTADEGGDYDDGFWESYSFGHGGKYDTPDLPHVKAALGEMEAKLNEWTEMLETAFGDHAQVVITRDGEVTIDEYEHD